MGAALGGAALGGLFQGLSDIGNAFVAHHAARDAWQHQRTMMKNAVTWRAQDLRKAGINPILAAEGLQPQAFSAQQMQTGAIGAGTRAAGATFARLGTMKSELESQAENRLLMRAQGIKAIADATSAQEAADMTRDRRTMELPALIEKLGADAGLSSAHANKLKQDYSIDQLGRYSEALARDRFMRGSNDDMAQRWARVHVGGVLGLPTAPWGMGLTNWWDNLGKNNARSIPQAPGVDPWKGGTGPRRFR